MAGILSLDEKPPFMRARLGGRPSHGKLLAMKIDEGP